MADRRRQHLLLRRPVRGRLGGPPASATWSASVEATGAGGANVWTSSQLRDALDGTDHALAALPGGAHFTIAFRRAIRSADGDGIPIEDLGIPGIPYEMTRRDLLREQQGPARLLHRPAEWRS